MSNEDQSNWRVTAGWGLVAGWVACTVLPFALPATGAGAAVLPLALLLMFAWTHGSVRYGARAIMLMFVAVVIVTNALENLSIATGVPFGFYEHQPSMGPKLFLVPMIVGPGYFSLCYLAWAAASALLNEADRDPNGSALLALAVLGAFIVTGVDAVVDPGGATVRHDWVYRYGGGYYGVPISNFGGWLVTSALAFLAGGWAMRRFGRPLRSGQSLGWWLQPAVLLILQPLPSLLSLLTVPARMEPDATGVRWNTGAIAEGTLVVGIVSCVAFGVSVVLQRWRHAASGALDRSPFDI